MPYLLTPRILHDLPLDQPGDIAEFNFHEYTNTFARLIADPATRTPLVIGVSGKWGSGKTTLLRTLQAKLEETRLRDQDRTKPAVFSFMNDEDSEGDFRRCRTVWFNAWKYADEDELLVALVRVIVQTMADDDAVSQILSKVLDPAYPRRDVVATVLSWFAIKLPGDVEVGLNTGAPKETPFAQKTALLDLFMETFDHLLAVWVSGNLFEKKIDPARNAVAVFIDDLDRCLPDKAVQVLEAIKLFLDRPGVAFVLAADEDAVRAAIEAHYQTQKITGQRASDYLEKIFQVRFVLPPLSASLVKNYLDVGLHVEDEKLRRSVELIIAGAETNPRQIKTFINYLELGWAILKNSGQAEGVEQDDFIRWLALTRVGPAFCDKVRDLPKDLRLNYIADAAQWANDPTHKASEYEQWQGPDNRRLREVMRLATFSPKVTPDALEGFIFWSGLAELEAQRRAAEEAEKKRQAELEERQRLEEAERKRQAELEAKRRADEEKAEKRRQAELEAQRLAEVEAEKRRRAELEEQRRVEEVERKRQTELEEKRRTEEAEKKRQARFNGEDYWVTIPAGKFVMGSRDDNKLAGDNEHPQHTVEIPYTYRIGRYPVTNAEFARFVQATGYKSDAVKDDLPDHPVVKVSWRDAQAYCKWLTDLLRVDGTLSANEIVRLPTEAEWEKAARGEYGREWPWGDEWDAIKCNSSEGGPGTTTPVGNYSPQGDSPYGVADMAGNVWEWCQSKYKSYPYRADDGREDLRGNEERVVRGASWSHVRRFVCATYRNWLVPAYFDSLLGFRVARSPVSRS